MALLLAPYNDSMRLGMGFNSYTQTLCIDNAVEIRSKEVVRPDNPSQVVTYSSKIVEHLSDVVSSLNVSHSASIRKGTVEIAGNGDSINEDKIKSSDINAVVSVKVVNQTLIVKDDAEFCAMYGVQPGTQRFNDTFGDCYISGFITGGEFTGIVSMRVIDRTKTASVTSAIKKGLRSAKGAKEFSLDTDSSSSESTNSELLKDTETTITVSWMGGGQVKDPRGAWTLDSVYAAAEAFPMLVSKCPQKTWAILTKYKANRSFVDQTRALSFSPLEYDLVAGFTSTLFDNYMEYKQLIKIVQDMMANPNNYKVRSGTQIEYEIGLEVDTLVAVRSAFQIEMNKIVQAVDILSQDPHMLKRSGKLTAEPKNATVLKIIKKATGNVSEKNKDAFWKFDKPAEPLPPILGRDQWVFLGLDDRAALQKAAEDTGSANSSGIPPLCDAWIEDNDKVLDKTTRPESTDDKGIWLSTRINRLQVAQGDNDEGSWEWGWVSVESLEKVRNKFPVAKASNTTAAVATAESPSEILSRSQSSGNGPETPASSASGSASDPVQVYSTQALRTGENVGQPRPAATAAYAPPPGYMAWGPNYYPPPQGYWYPPPGYGPPPSSYPYGPPGYQPGYPPPSAAIPQITQKPAETKSSSDNDDVKSSGDTKGKPVPATEPKSAASGSSGAPKSAPAEAEKFQPVRHRAPYQENVEPTLDFDMMISPEIWTNLLPVAKEDASPVPGATASAMPESLANAFPTAPMDDIAELRKRAATQASQKLEILSAACGVVDCTDNLRELVQPDGTLTIDSRKLSDLLSGHTQPQRVKPEELYLTFIFRYPDQPMQLFVNSPSAQDKVYTISPTSKDYAVVTPTTWNKETWATVAIVFGGRQISDGPSVGAVLAKIKENYNDGAGTRHVRVGPDLVKVDPLPGRCKTAVIFYQIRSGGQVRCAVGVESGTPCMLTDRLLPDVFDPKEKAATDAELVRLEQEATAKDRKIATLESSASANTASSTQKDQRIAELERDNTNKDYNVRTLERAASKITWKLMVWTFRENTITIYPGKGEEKTTESLDVQWNRAKVQLFSNKARKVLNFADPTAADLYADPIYNHQNHTITLQLEGNSTGGKYWWSLIVDNGTNALEMENNKIVKKPKNTSREGQQWYILRATDQFSFRIRTKKWEDCYITLKDDSKSELIGRNRTETDWALCEFQAMIVEVAPAFK